MDAKKTALFGTKGKTVKMMEVKHRHKKTKVTKSSKDFACKNLRFSLISIYCLMLKAKPLDK